MRGLELVEVKATSHGIDNQTKQSIGYSTALFVQKANDTLR